MGGRVEAGRGKAGGDWARRACAHNTISLQTALTLRAQTAAVTPSLRTSRYVEPRETFPYNLLRRASESNYFFL